MFNKGQYIVYSSNGVYQVEDIQTMEVGGVVQESLYYSLAPVSTNGSKIYTPVDRLKNAREIISKETANSIFDKIMGVEEFDIPNNKLREAQYKESMVSCDCLEWIKVIKTTYTIKKQRKLAKKRMGYTDDKYFKEAQNALFVELAVVLEDTKENIEQRFYSILDAN